jgi:pyruvate formate lyase activating enzyme
MKKAELWLPDKRSGVRCIACCRRCIIPLGRSGYCGTRENIGGELFLTTWGHVAGGGSMDAIEKKPLYHFHPGTLVYSVGGWGCNFHCGMCQNYHIAHIVPNLSEDSEKSPEWLVKDALKKGAKGIAFTYNEPALWPEYIRDTFKLAKSEGLYTVVVTNGTFTKEALDYIGEYTDASAVDIKGMSDVTLSRIGVEGVDPADILEGTVYARDRWGIHIECITNIIPTVNDSSDELMAIATWIHDSLGPRVPWHVTRFFPALRFAHLMPTDLSVLQKAYRIGLDVGLSFVYVGNILSDTGSTTYCPNCHAIVIEREGNSVKEKRTVLGRCTRCGESLGIVEDI